MAVRQLLVVVLVLVAAGLVSGEDKGPAVKSGTAAERDARLAWWRNARFGVFIHWGVYAVPAGEWKGKPVQATAEWIMNAADIAVRDYESLAKRFNPVKYDPAAWVRAAKGAGAKYIVITSKHHDGFCLFDTKTNDWDVVDATPYGKDLLKPLAGECRKQGIRFCAYYSIMDWHHPAQERGGESYNPTKMKAGHKQEYVDCMKMQLRELMDSCSPDVLWFDGEWPDWWTEEDGRALYDYVRELKPAIIVNNRVGKGRDGMKGFAKDGREYAGDFGTPEQEIPATGLRGVDWESCMTMNDTWGFNKSDTNWKSAEVLIRNLVDIASKGGNYLLNVGPTAEGEIPAASRERLAAMGQWMHTNGESIYGTSASPFRELSWGRATATRKGRQSIIYLHVFDWPADGKLHVPAVSGSVQSCSLLATKASVPTTREGDGVVLELPSQAVDSVDSVIELVVNSSGAK